MSISPTWDLSRQFTQNVDYTVPGNTETRLLETDIETPLGLGGRQGFHVSFEVTVPTGDGEKITSQRQTTSPLIVPVAEAPRYQTVICTAGTDELPPPVRVLLQNWGFDIYLAKDVQAAQHRFDEFEAMPICFIGVLSAPTGDDRGQQLVSNVAWIADDREAMTLIFADEDTTLPSLPSVRAVFRTDLTDKRQLMRVSGPELLTVRLSFQTGQREIVLDWLREKATQAKHEPKELLRALAYAVIFEKTGVTEHIVESVDIPESLATGLTKPTTTITHPPWPMFRVDNVRTGSHSKQQGPKGNITEQWTFEFEMKQRGPSHGHWVNSSPAVVDGTVYVGSRDKNVYALDAETGRERWTFETGGSVSTSPAVVDGTVYIRSFHSVHALTEA